MDALIIHSNGREVAASFAGDSVAAAARVLAVTSHWAGIALTTVKAKASTGFHAPGEGHIPGTGPGPNVATGDYLRSMGIEMEVGPGVVIAHIGTNKPQARALELGDHGVDAAGRHHNTPPYEHWGPMADEIVEPFEAAVVAGVVV